MCEIKERTGRINVEMGCSEGMYLGRSDRAAMVGLADNVIDDHLGDLPCHFLLRLDHSTTLCCFRAFNKPCEGFMA